jgi:hypothetical protein
MRSITCTNKVTGISITFGEEAFAPFFLATADGIYVSKNNVYISKNTMTDGGTYQGSVAEDRNIVLYVMDNPQSNDFVYNQRNRDLLYSLFRKDEEGTLVYTENGKSRKINYVSEGVKRANKGSRLFTISLICPNPRFTDETEHNVSMANWIDGFEFIHEFVEEGEEFGYRSNERLVNIVNDVATNNIGLTITIQANGTVVNPSITHVEMEKSIKIGSNAKPFTMARGDVLVITTGINNKHVRLTSGNVTTEVNEYLTEDSEFIQLMFGDNNIAYDASSGDEYMVVNIKYAYEYEGA